MRTALRLFLGGAGVVLSGAFLWAGYTGETVTEAVKKHSVKVPLKIPQTQTLSSQKLSVPKPSTLNADMIRVGIGNDEMTEYEYPRAIVSANGPFFVLDQATGKTLLEGKANQWVTIERDASGFHLAGISSVLTGPLQLKPKSAAHWVTLPQLTRRGKQPFYKGHLELVAGKTQPNLLSVVNVLPMQEYLKAVVPNELPFHYGAEAVKAQSVAARNYAIRPRENPWPQFDICDSQFCQVYFGALTESTQVTQAIQETDGLYALYQGQPILALYSSAHGGYSESYQNVFSDVQTGAFPGPVIPYLQGHPDQPAVKKQFPSLSDPKAVKQFWTSKTVTSYDQASPQYRWTRFWSTQAMEAILAENLLQLSTDPLTQDFITPHLDPGTPLGKLKTITVKQRGVSGKAMVLVIQTDRGQWTLKKEFVIRKAFQQNGRMLPSANVVIEPQFKNKQLVGWQLWGGGFGHGVGMSQIGASAMNHLGFQFPDILKHYYTGIALGTRPLKIDVRNHPAQALETQFYLKAPKTLKRQPVLCIQLPKGALGQKPITVLVNQKSVTVPLSGEKNTLSLSLELFHVGRNQLTALPSEQPYTAWLEVFQ